MPKEYFVRIPQYTEKFAEKDQIDQETWVKQSLKLGLIAMKGAVFELKEEQFVQVNFAEVEPIASLDEIQTTAESDEPIIGKGFKIPDGIVPIIAEHFLDPEE